MPRPKVTDRKRAEKACTSCKRRKEKCDGIQPCGRCKHRNRETECSFPGDIRSTNIRNASTGAIYSHLDSFECDGSSVTNEPRHDILRRNVPNGDTASLNAATSAPVQELPRFLQDPEGKFIYIGDSASLSFLQTVRRIVRSSIGECHLTTDELRHQLIETSPNIANIEAMISPTLPNLNEALALVREYVVAVSGALDLFDEIYISHNIRAWLGDPTSSGWTDCCIYHLVLALGAQARARDYHDDWLAEQHFAYGRDLAVKHLVDNPSLVTVQAFSLITWYMVTASRRNGATMNLGFAVQAAYALGIHRHEANVAFGAETAKSRERAWKTLRVCDLFLSASMGRPSITSRIDANIPSGPSSLTDPSDRLASAMTRICLIFERILSEVYTHHTVSLELAASISEQHRVWTEALPEMLEADGLSPEELAGPVDLSKTLGSAIVVMAYHYSIILLTRPFLTFEVNRYIGKEGRRADKPGAGPNITTYADACVTSAINGIGLACDILSYDKIPKRLSLIVNSVFISALVLGLAYFGDYHYRGWALDKGLEQAIRVLQRFGLNSPQPARYQQIVEHLRSAATQYKDRHQDIKMKSYNQQVNNVFGNVSAQLDRGRISTVRPNMRCEMEDVASMRAPSMIDSEPGSGDLATSTYGSLDTIPRTSLITTSGKLAAARPEHEGLQWTETVTGNDIFSSFGDGMLENTTGDLSFLENGPLFALMQNYYPA